MRAPFAGVLLVALGACPGPARTPATIEGVAGETGETEDREVETRDPLVDHDDAPPPPETADQAALRAAKQAYLEGVKLYEAGDYQLAIEAWLRAYSHQNQPALLYNIGQAYKQLGDVTHATDAWREFQRLDPDASARVDIDARIQELGAAP